MNATDQIQPMLEQALSVISVYGLDVLGAIAILVVGWVAAKWAQSATCKALERIKSIDAMLRSFFASLVKYVILAFTVIAVLNRFGVETTSLVALLGAAGLAIGLALQGTLSNVAAGVMLLLFRPFKVGDYIESPNATGSVKSMGLFTTDLTTPDNIYVMVPNSQLWGSAIRNFTYNPTRRIEFVVGISYGADIDQARDVIKGYIASDERIHAEPEPLVEAWNLGDSAVEMIVRVWTNTDVFWAVKFDLIKGIKKALDANGIAIPFPQRDVHLYQQKS